MKGKLKKWLKENGKNSLGTVLDKIGENTSIPIASGIIESIGESLMDDPELTPEQQKELAEIMNEELSLLNEDRASAREMQKTALNQEDIFSKRFIYYFAGFMAISVLIILILLFFVEIPSENQRIVDMTLGIFIGSGFIQIINFLYGSSKGSKDKLDLMNLFKRK